MASIQDTMARYSPKALHVLSFMVFWGQIQNYMMRVNLSILIVAMVSNGGSTGNGVSAESCIANDTNARMAGSSTSVLPTASTMLQFDWDEATRGLILGSFGWGYVTTQIIGVKNCILIFILSTSTEAILD